MPEVVFRHPEWVVLDKPEGFTVQELAEAYSPLFDAFHPAHRLDKETSGLWLVALNSAANAELSSAFRNRLVKKAYLAVTVKKPKKKQGGIVGDMVRSRSGQWKLAKTRNNPAITWFRSVGMKEGYRLVLCRPETGKTHQLRVALQSNGSPVFGDVLYGGKSAAGADRLYLHSYALDFSWQGEPFSFCREPSSGHCFSGEEFRTALALFDDPLGIGPSE